MFGDPGAIRALARPLHERAGELRALSGRLVDQARATSWEGLAADAMRAVVGGSAGDLRRTADLHDEAAAALERHADHIAAALAAIERTLHAHKKALGA
jgi:hypothetical protein